MSDKEEHELRRGESFPMCAPKLNPGVPLRPRRDAPSLLLSGFSMELEARIWFAAPPEPRFSPSASHGRRRGRFCRSACLRKARPRDSEIRQPTAASRSPGKNHSALSPIPSRCCWRRFRRLSAASISSDTSSRLQIDQR